MPFSVIVYLWDCLNAFLVSLRSSCLLVCLSACVHVAFGFWLLVGLFVLMPFWCPLDQVAYLSVCPLVSMWLVDQVGLFVLMSVCVHYFKLARSQLRNCEAPVQRRILSPSDLQSPVRRIVLQKVKHRRLSSKHRHLFNGFPPSFTMLVKCFQLL